MTLLFDQRFPADLSRMAALRAAMRTSLVAHGLSEVTLERLILVVDEVVSNSIEHGLDYRVSADPIRVCVERSTDDLLLQVEDQDVPPDLVRDLARVFDDGGEATPSAMAERGRGMFLITMFLEDLQIVVAEGGGMRLLGRLACQP